jgi:hypothetical protein
MRCCLIVVHVVVTLYVVRWTAFMTAGGGLGTVAIMNPLQAISILCLLGMVYAVGADDSHWTRRHLGWLNFVAAATMLLWTLGYSEGPLYRALAARGSAAWGEMLIALVLIFGPVLGISLGLVRRTESIGAERDLGRQGVLVISGLVCVAGSLPWLWKMSSTSSPVSRSYAWSSTWMGTMEVATILATCLAGFALLRRRRFASGVAFAEALAVPLIVRLVGW